jgi:hypothetical protein
LSTQDKWNVTSEQSHKNQKELFNLAIGISTPKETEPQQESPKMVGEATKKKALLVQQSIDDSFDDMLERDDYSDHEDKIYIAEANPTELNMIVDTCQRILNNETSLGKTM